MANRPHSLRFTVVCAAELLIVLALAAAGFAAFSLQRRTDARAMDSRLNHVAQEVRGLAQNGVDPRTGERYTDVSSLLRQALIRQRVESNEGEIALVDGRVQWTNPDNSLSPALQDDPELVAAVHRTPSSTWLRSVVTHAAEYRLIEVPVVRTGDPHVGLVVFAIDRSAQLASLGWNHVRVYGPALAIAVVVSGSVGFVLLGRVLRPLRVLEASAALISEQNPVARVPLTGRDQVSLLASRINLMLDRLSAGYESQRHLLDDVRHELRTPITVIRGHVDLMDPNDPRDASATRELVLDELDRMGRLVAGLMLLARSEEPAFAAPKLTELAPLFDEIADKARGLGERRWRIVARDEALAVVDPHRITQAVLQLIDNAVKVSDPGSEIRLGLRRDETTAVISVSDDGPGLDPGRADEIFARHVRLETSRDGLGLGLAIVRAIAREHGGDVLVESAPGHGATFTFLLPLSDGRGQVAGHARTGPEAHERSRR